MQRQLEVKRPMGAFRWSPSQVDTFRDCPLKWAYGALGGLRAPPHASADLGTRVHAVREKWFIHGVYPKGDTREEQIARLGLSELPAPKTVFVETKFELTPPGLGVVAGRIDIFVPDQGVINYFPTHYDEHGIAYTPDTRGVPLVHDHKTTSDIKENARSLKVLKNEDAQVAVYGVAALAQTGAQYVDFCWHYLETGKKLKHEPRRFRLSSSQILLSFDRVQEDVRKMLSLFDARASLRIEDVPRDARACTKYGGCGYLHICPVTTEERCVAMMSTTTSLKEKMKMSNGQFPTVAPNGQFPMAPMSQQAQAILAQAPLPSSLPPSQPAMPPSVPQLDAQQLAWASGNPGWVQANPQYAAQVQAYVASLSAPPAMPTQLPPAAPAQLTPTQVLPPDAPPQTLADAAAASAAAPPATGKKRGRPKKNADAAPEGDSDVDENIRAKFALAMLDSIVSSRQAEGEAAVKLAVQYADALLKALG